MIIGLINDMFLLYINEVGVNYKGQKVYEFIFGENTDVKQEDWYNVPSSSTSQPPSEEYVNIVGTLKNSELNLTLIQDSDYFGVIDSVNGVVALGWENFDINYEKRTNRLFFNYGETIESVMNKIKKHNLEIIIEKIND